MSRFLEKSTLSLTKVNAISLEKKYPFFNIYGSKEDDRIFVNMEAIPELTGEMKTQRDIAEIIDISGSMREHYKSGAVERFCIQIVESLAPYDPDGIDLYFFASRLVYKVTVKNEQEVKEAIAKVTKMPGAFGTTMPIEAFKDFATQLKKKQRSGTVMFLTDGGMDDKGAALKRFYQEVLHKEFKTRDHFYCFAIEFGSGASGALKMLDGLYAPEQGPEDLFDIYKTNSLKKISAVLEQVGGMSAISSALPVMFSTRGQAPFSMVNQNLILDKTDMYKTTVHKVMSLGFKTKETFFVDIQVDGYPNMTLKVTPQGDQVHVEIVDAPVQPVAPALPVQPSTPAPAVAALSLQKGQKVSLSKVAPMLDELLVGLRWDTSRFPNHKFDLDVQAFMVNEQEKVPHNGYFVFYNQDKSFDGSVIFNGDNQDGEGDGDDESLNVTLSKVAPEVKKIIFTVTIHDAKSKGQTFGMVDNAAIRIVDSKTGNTVIEYLLNQQYSSEISLVVGELYRHQGEWKFNAVGAGWNLELFDFCNQYGVVLS